MRELSESLKKKLASRIQAGSTRLNASLWVSRPRNPITEPVFLESQLLSSARATKTSIAVCHPRIMRGATDIYVGYVESGEAKITKTSYNHRMSNHIWEPVEFSQWAEDISLCFDGTMPKDLSGRVEFVTEDLPWVFWTLNGVLYAQKLHSTEEPTVLAEANCTAVSSVRSVWSEAGAFDFGLIVFFILSGNLYYRQLINGEWTDGELVSAGPEGVLWTDVSAFRTWDYRVGVQLVSRDGKLYELYTQYMGIGKQNSEHVEISDMRPSANLIEVHYTDSSVNEHVEISEITPDLIYKGLYAVGVPSLVDVYNQPDESGDWGKQVVFVFDKELEANSVEESLGSFYFIDSQNRYFFPYKAEMDETGKLATLFFVDFNSVGGDCVAHYTPGTVVTMVDESLPAQERTFTPMNLVPNDTVFPEVAEILAVDPEGTMVSIRFTEALTEVPAESAENFIVTIQYPLYIPGGPTSPLVCPVLSVSTTEADDTIMLHFADGMETSIRNAIGEVSIQYLGTIILGAQGPALGFLKTFIPQGLQMKPNPAVTEHVEIGNMTSESVLTKIYYTDNSFNEHMEINDMSWEGVLTHVDDI